MSAFGFEPRLLAQLVSGVRFKVGEHVIDPDLFEIHRQGVRQAIQPRAFDLLLYLLVNRHRVVSARELFEKVWAGVHVSPDSLTYAVKAARRALGDDGKTQAVITSVRRRGYRFTHPIELLPGR